MLKYKRLLTVVFPSKVKPILQPTALIWTWRHKSGSEASRDGCNCWFGMPAGVALVPSLNKSVVSGLQLHLHVLLRLSVTCGGAERPHGTDGVERRGHIAPLHFEVLRQKRERRSSTKSQVLKVNKLKHGGSCGGRLGWKVTILPSFRDGGRCFHCLKVVITVLPRLKSNF